MYTLTQTDRRALVDTFKTALDEKANIDNCAAKTEGTADEGIFNMAQYLIDVKIAAIEKALTAGEIDF